jgi:hypothetical protein
MAENAWSRSPRGSCRVGPDLEPHVVCVRPGLPDRDAGTSAVGIPQHRHARPVRQKVAEEVQPLRGQVGRQRRYAGDVPARPREARDDSQLDRIASRRHDDGYGGRRGVRGHERRHSGRDDDVHVEPHELGGKVGKPLDLTPRPSPLEGDGTTFDMAQLAHAPQEAVPPGEPRGVGSAVVEQADTRDLPRLLRLRGHRSGEQGHREGRCERRARSTASTDPQTTGGP